MAADLSSWWFEDRAAEILQVSGKSVQQFAKEGRIEKRLWQPGGRGPRRAVYNPDDVVQLAAERRPEAVPFVVRVAPAGNGHGNGQSTLEAVERERGDAGQALLAMLSGFAAALRTVAASTSETSETSQKSFLTVPEAAALTGLTETFLRRMIARGTLVAIKDRGWKVRRKDLEAL
jgi:excisionase family DNA binding protein